MRVLVVDDEQRLARSLKLGLEAEGFAVDVAHDGTDGLWLARENEYDAIVLDLMLPGINGYKVCETLRAEKDWTPILMLTAKDGELDEAEGLDTGADDYLTKPFSIRELAARVHALLRRVERAASAAASRITVADLEIDLAERRVVRGGEEAHLTPTEFELLVHLAERPRAVQSRERLLSEVWDWDVHGNASGTRASTRYRATARSRSAR